ncbi:hypothetical protein Vi05172_g5117 [Venturia inaequalis]|nr:hypothetical protein Vi05172_g5117 [Venturia inaequalis]
MTNNATNTTGGPSSYLLPNPFETTGLRLSET